MVKMQNMDKYKLVTCAISYIMAKGRPCDSRELYSHFRSCKIPTYRNISQASMVSILKQVARMENRWNIECLHEATDGGNVCIWGLRR